MNHVSFDRRGSISAPQVSLTRGRRRLLRTLALVLVAVVLWRRHWLEADMARHLLLEFPLVIASGVLLGATSRHNWLGAPRRNRYGLTGLTLAALTLTIWMIPAALDAAAKGGWVSALKYDSLAMAGFLLPASLRLAPLAVQAVFVGNMAWMTATAGILYQQADRQLCLAYLTEMQTVTGRGLVVAAAVLVVVWSVWTWRRSSAA